VSETEDPGSPRDRLLQAVIDLLPDCPADSLSVRDIAAEAGVNHGLVHRHFGSKEALLREAISRATAEVRSTDPGRSAGSVWTWELLRSRPEIARILARLCLDGPKDLLPLATPPPGRIEAYVAPIRRILASHGFEAVDPYLVNAFGCAALLGFAVFRPLLDAGWRLPADTDEQVARLAPLLDAFLEAHEPPADEPARSVPPAG
jgi:AcrR family transcriptional regulator